MYSTILLAGHDTSASTLTWWFLELARHPDWQTRVREEVCAARRKLIDAGVDEFSLSDLEGMTVMQATLKVHRFYWTQSLRTCADRAVGEYAPGIL